MVKRSMPFMMPLNIHRVTGLSLNHIDMDDFNLNKMSKAGYLIIALIAVASLYIIILQCLQ